MMSILPFLHFFVFLVYSCLLVFLLWKDSKSWLNRVCAAFLACFSVWSFGAIFIYDPHAIKDTVILFGNVTALGWISFASFFLWFSLIFTEKKKILKAKMIYPLIFILPLLLIYQQWTGFLTADYIQQPWGWESIWSDSIWSYLFYFYYLSFMLMGLYLILNFGRKTEEPLKKKQARIIFVTTLVSLFLSTLTDVIFPVLNIYTLPSLGNVIALIWASGIVYAIAKYKLMVITSVAAAENILSTMTDSLVLLDRKGDIAIVNKATLDLSGYLESEVEGKSVEMLFAEKDFKNTLLDKAIKKEAIRNYELDFKTKTRDHIPVVFSSSTMVDKAGGMVGIVCIIKDITQRKYAEETVKKSQQEFAGLFYSNPEALVYLDENENILNVNPRFIELFGYNLEEIKGKKINDGLIHPADKIEESYKLIIKTLQGYHNYETIRKKKDGTLFPVSLSATSLEIDGQIKGRIVTFIDISERIKLQNALQKSEERLSFTLDATNDGIWDSNLESGKLYLNDRYYEMLGYQPGEIAVSSNKGFEDLIHPEDKERVLQKMQECIEGKTKDYNEEFRMKTKSGKWKWIMSRGNVVSRDSTGKALRFLGTHVDITQRKKVEETLHKTQQEFTSLFQSNPEATIYLDKDGNILNINNRFTELFGYTLEEIKGKNIDAGLIQPQDKIKESKKLTEKALKENYISIETIRKKKDGTLFPVHLSASPLNIDGKHQGMIGIYQDISERKEMEEKLEKLARIDSLTGGYNRRYGLELLDRQMKLSHRSKSSLLLAFLDIDRFKSINDTYGHDEGDLVLKEVVKLFKSTLREIDITCRMGGDEFLIIFPDNSLKEAPLIKERLDKDLIRLNQTLKKPYQIELSIGLSEYDPVNPLIMDELIRIADQKMYEEKKRKK